LLVAIAVPFAMFAGQLEGVLQPLLIKQFENGVARTLEAAAFAIAIFHYDLLGVGLKARSASRASTATAALAALLITAQVAQNYLSATYGLLMGGVIAGAVVFAANPIQKHIERIGVHDRHVTTSSAASSRREETYKSAVRLALRGGIDPTEEVELMRIADANGIGNVRAAELRRQVVDAARRGERI
jgi:hypothetical protein